jgi:hypothetical protein
MLLGSLRNGCGCRRALAVQSRVAAAIIVTTGFSIAVHAQGIGPQTIVLWTANVPPSNVHGLWSELPDATAAGQIALIDPNNGVHKISPALATPVNYFEIAFNADAGVPYHLWVRLRAYNNRLSNDSIHVQFSDSLDASGAPTARIGTTSSAEVVLQNGSGGSSVHNWGWSDNGWGAPGAPIQFAASGSHVLRVQQREDGAIVDQIVLSADTFASAPPGPRQDDTTILARTDGTPVPAPPATDTAVVWTANIPASSIFGSWNPIADATAAGGTALENPNAGQSKISPALATPTNYFETIFSASAGVPYHVWLRIRAQGDSLSNDSVHVQFNDSLDATGAPFARIDTTSSAEFVLQDGANGLAPHGWGWTDNGWTSFGANIFFGSSGSHTLRVQQREDGAIVDQIVVSPDAYLTSPPGFRFDDATILSATGGGGTSNQPPTASLTAPANGASFIAPANITLAASASDADGTVQKVDFYSGTTLLGTATSAPYSFAWNSVPAGSYTLKAVATDNSGAQTSSATVAITVTAPNQPPTVALTSPANGATFTAPATVTIAATASDADGAVQKVDFYAGSTLLGTSTTAPYSFTWSNVAAGSYTIKSIATDNSGAQTSSATVSITVNTAVTQSYTVAFTASTDHDTDVTSYLLEVFANGADPNTAQALASVDMGKPTPDANREIDVNETSFLSALSSGTYLVTVSAIGPGGQARSAPYTFTR